MTEQAASGTMAGDTGAHGLDAQTGMPHEQEGHHGSPSSWAAVSIIIIGFTVSGVAMVLPHQAWWLFWTGAGIVVIGGIIALSTRILDDWY